MGKIRFANAFVGHVPEVVLHSTGRKNTVVVLSTNEYLLCNLCVAHRPLFVSSLGIFLASLWCSRGNVRLRGEFCDHGAYPTLVSSLATNINSIGSAGFCWPRTYPLDRHQGAGHSSPPSLTADSPLISFSLDRVPHLM